ncbi:phospholipase B1, membrane-associated-like [Hetaerina americana]|uniref:phospholipase B1, membrane-associated-like n=1 Tax=Hetaerina americana TaxID=62018 RepID=UPI003A7F365A
MAKISIKVGGHKLEQILSSSAYAPEEWHKIVQDKIPDDAEFPCHIGEGIPRRRSSSKPTSVHELRPGDIDIIMVLGDSLSAGAAALEPTPLGFFTDHRGVSFVGGGEKTWREFTTLPNILKEFNPHLYGYATGKGTFFSEEAKFNVAISGSIDDDLLIQTQLLGKKVLQDSNVDLINDWKLINIFTGHNDICTYECFEPERHSAEAHKLQLKEVVDLIYDQIPRVFVNLISVLDPTLNSRIPKTAACDILRQIQCPCLLQSPDLQENILNRTALAREYQRVEMELASDPRYNGRDDFAVVWQPLFLAFNGPMSAGEPECPEFSKLVSSKYPFHTPDCFHLNQRGSALAARMLWNNMLEPVGSKTSTLKEILRQTIKCPTKEMPYLFTAKNSAKYRMYSHQ